MATLVKEVSGVAPLNLSEAGSWLCSRHPGLRELVERIGLWNYDTGEPMMPRIRDELVNYDQREAGASPAMVQMTPSEVNRLRLLATLAPKSAFFGRVEFCITDLQGFDRTTGQPLVEDWLRCIRIGLFG